MIYINLLYFLIAIVLFSMTPATPSGYFPMGQNLLVLAIISVWFWHFNRYRFLRLRARLENDEISEEQAHQRQTSYVNTHFIISLVIFAVEIFFLDLKFLIVQIPFVAYSDLLVNGVGLGFFVAHLCFTWYWSFRALGRPLELGDSSRQYIVSNIKFNMVIILPWLCLLVVGDILGLFHISTVGDDAGLIINLVFIGLFLVLFSLLGPLLIARLWDCRPLPPSDLKGKIEAFCREKGVKFRGIVSWNALNKTMITAGVMGVTGPFRYLMITPGLMNLLDEDEIMAVVCHEVGHVKKRHHLWYIFFFISFIVLVSVLQGAAFPLIFSPAVLVNLMVGNDGVFAGMLNFFFLFFSIVTIVIYIRFVFGYFMRNFERQADAYCFEAGINPDHLISSFSKLGLRMREDSKKRNWHHFNIVQRIEFLLSAKESPQVVSAHNKKVKKGLMIFSSILVVFVLLASTFISNQPLGDSRLEGMVTYIEKRLEKTPDNPQLYTLLGDIYYQLERWNDCRKAYEYSVGLNNRQPDVMNNLAWLLLKSEDESIRNPKRALKLAEEAVKMSHSPQLMDTLAEAYYQNGMYEEAYKASQSALKLANDNRTYFLEQLQKMKSALDQSGQEKPLQKDTGDNDNMDDNMDEKTDEKTDDTENKTLPSDKKQQDMV